MKKRNASILSMLMRILARKQLEDGKKN